MAPKRPKPAIFEGFGLVENNVENVQRSIRGAQSARTRMNCGRKAGRTLKYIENKALRVIRDGICVEYIAPLGVKYL